MAKQKDKPGKILRVDKDTWDFIQSVRSGPERLTDLVRRLIGLSPKGEVLTPPKSIYTLPSMLFETKEEAKGEALYKSVKEKTDLEEPIKVRRVK